MIDLSGQKYLVTASTSGIGLVLTILLNKLGARVLLFGGIKSKLKEVKDRSLFPDKS